MAVITNQTIDALFTSFSKKFQDGLNAAPSQYTQIATMIKSTTASNTYGWLGQFPTFKEWTGQRTFRDMAAHSYQIVNKKFESTVSVSRDQIEDDNLGLFSPMFEQMGRAAGTLPDEQIFPLIRNGETIACYDGQPFFDDEHPVYSNVDGTGTAVLVSNLLKASGGEKDGEAWYLLDNSQVIKPFIWQERVSPVLEKKTSSTNSDRVFEYDEFAFGGRARGDAGFGLWQLCIKVTAPLTPENYEKARLMMRQLKADGGRPLNIRPTHILVPPSLHKAAKNVVGTALINNTDNPYYKDAEIIESAWLNYGV